MDTPTQRRQRKYYVKNRDKILARGRRYYLSNRRSESLRKQKYHAKNRDAVLARQKAWYLANKEAIKARQRKYRARSAEAIAAKNARYRLGNIEAIRAHDRQRKGANRANIAIYLRNRKLQDKNFALRMKLSHRISEALRWSGIKKSLRTAQLIGCDIPSLRSWIETQFSPGMSWDNWTRSGWHIDHKRPCASFDLTDPEQQRACFHFSNLQPLWAADNLSKGAKMPPELIAA